MNFSELNLHPTVAGALAKRGYETATPVQAAVLHPDAAGRDLLVSSQTGSGKTIAFGAALAESLLASDAARTGSKTNPLALVVVPTRELAVQVREELGWLLRDTKLRLASFTGGTPVSGDLRTLQKGLDIAIGTPGRLVDLLRRQRLELADVRAVVLDEADEMLDLGFREDLQTLLQAAPESRRTLLLSATLPPEIQALARRFQRDALRIDPRKEGGQTAQAGHGDITYAAHLIAGADRLAVVVNILRAAGNGRAIVFCTTREGVSRLHAALQARGFATTAISGDRAQAERDRALEQVRKGDARVLVATNVAARGLHLPDVDLIIHADLPLNAESLTHRSGRTGRAGRKGTAVVIASMTERRKAERLMMSAHVPVVWTAPPSAESITAAARERLIEELLQEASADSPPEDPAAEAMVTRLEELLPARELARRLLLRELVHLPVGERVQHVPVPGPERRDRFAPARGDGEQAGFGGDGGGGRRPGRSDFAREGVKFRINIGAKDNADPRWLLPLICRRGGVTSRDVGSIRVGPQETVFEISGDAARDFALSAAERDPRAPHVAIQPWGAGSMAGGNRHDGGDDRDREPRRPAPAPRPAAKPAKAAAPKVATPKVATAKASSPKVAAAPIPEPSPAPVAPAAAGQFSAPPPATPRAPIAPATPIFQTRTPLPAGEPAPRKEAPPAERPRSASGGGPVIEMKRAPRLGPPSGTRAAVPAPVAAPPRAPAPGPQRDGEPPRRDGTNLVKRSFKPKGPIDDRDAEIGDGADHTTGQARRAASPYGVSGKDGPRPHQPRPFDPRNGRSSLHGRPPGGRPSPDRSARPSSVGKSPHPRPVRAAGGPGRPPSAPSGAPFWKEGARKRPGPPPARHPASGDVPGGKPPRR